MTWNYRLIRHVAEHEEYLEVHEVYYNEDGSPRACTEKGVSVYGESIEEIEQAFDWMIEALEKPVLDYDDF